MRAEVRTVIDGKVCEQVGKSTDDHISFFVPTNQQGDDTIYGVRYGVVLFVLELGMGQGCGILDKVIIPPKEK